jgi:hypothetical protein
MYQTAVSDSLSTASSFFQTEHTFKWFMMESNIIYYVAVAIGFFIIFVSYFFGGGKKNKVKIFISIALGVVIGVLTLPLLLKIAGQGQPLVIAFFILLDIIFTATVACHMYELVVIGTHEAFDGGGPTG